MTAGAIRVPDHWWSLIDDVVEAYFKCIYNPKLNGIIFQFGIKKWGRKIRKPHGSN
ncbi:hypothetical protein RhiirB3_451193 [Rhizophagus irregularis]|nr:hypothetical protein RhiirB3_451193 [Rhizophagus irregularis]